MTEHLIELAENDLAQATDNLARARIAARRHPVNAPWGESGQTLGQIIEGYEEWVTKARETLAYIRSDKRTLSGVEGGNTTLNTK